MICVACRSSFVVRFRAYILSVFICFVAIPCFSEIPVGTIIAFYSTNYPAGWLKCDGSSVAADDYPELYALIGGTLPDLRKRFLFGSASDYALRSSGGYENVTLVSNQIPAHVHGPGSGLEYLFYIGPGFGSVGWSPINENSQFIGGNKTASSGGGQAHSNMPPYVVVDFLIRAVPSYDASDLLSQVGYLAGWNTRIMIWCYAGVGVLVFLLGFQGARR